MILKILVSTLIKFSAENRTFINVPPHRVVSEQLCEQLLYLFIKKKQLNLLLIRVESCCYLTPCVHLTVAQFEMLHSILVLSPLVSVEIIVDSGRDSLQKLA